MPQNGHHTRDEMQQGNTSPMFLMRLEIQATEVVDVLTLYKEKGIDYYWKQVEKIKLAIDKFAHIALMTLTLKVEVLKPVLILS